MPRRKSKPHGAPIFQFRLAPVMKRQLVAIAKRMDVTPSEINRVALKHLFELWRDDRPAVETLVLNSAMENIDDPRAQTDLFD